MKNRDFNIEKFLDLTEYADENRKNRRKGFNSTEEFFTPYCVVKKMCDLVPEEDWSDESKTFLEPSFGNGQLLIYMIYNRLEHGIDIYQTFKTLYGTELLQENVDECRTRIFRFLDEYGIEYDKDLIDNILNKNLVCTDFFAWDYENWRPLETGSKKLF